MPKTRQKKSIYAIAGGGVLSSLLIASAYAQYDATCELGTPQLIIYHAGSLTAAFTPIEKLFTQQTAICVVAVSAGSIDAARRITAGKELCDIFASADDGNIDQFLKPVDFADYNVCFA